MKFVVLFLTALILAQEGEELSSMPPARTKKGRLPARFDVQLWPTQYLDSDAESAAEETEQPKSEEPTDIFQRHHKQLSRASDPKARAELARSTRAI